MNAAKHSEDLDATFSDPSTGSNETQQLRWNSSLGRVVNPESEAPVVEMPAHAVEPRRDPAAARTEKPDPYLWMLIARPIQITARHASIISQFMVFGTTPEPHVVSGGSSSSANAAGGTPSALRR